MKRAAETPVSRKDAGFTLFESVVALGIFALVAVSALELVTQNVRSAAALETRSLAGHVAENLMVDTRLERILKTSETAGSVEMGGQNFDWQRAIADTDHPGLKRVTIRVYRKGEGQVVAELSGFWNG